jgi:hypothetical protein
MEYIVYFVRIDGAVISYPASSRAEAADIVFVMTVAHLDEGGHGNPITDVEDDVLIYMMGVDNEPTAAFVAAPADRDLIDVMKQYISPDLCAENFTFVSLDELHDPNISIH